MPLPHDRTPPPRLLMCPRCSYDIAGLPRQHRCPECGFAYDGKMFILEGWRVPDVRQAWARLVRNAVGMAIVLLLVRWTLLVSWIRLGWIFVGAVLVYLAADVYVRVRHGGDGHRRGRHLGLQRHLCRR